MIEMQLRPDTLYFEFELVTADEFKTDLTWPTCNADVFPVSIYIDGILIKTLASDLCDCPVKLLFESGCQCGGE